MKNITILLFICACIFWPIYAFSQERIRVVNMIPNRLSYETNQDSEPNIAVNPSNINQIAGSCFRPNPALSATTSPIFVSTNGGQNWTLKNIVPGNNPRFGTGDISLKFSTGGNSLYTGILRGDEGLRMNILTCEDPFVSNSMQLLADRNQTDQPYVNVVSSMVNENRQDRVFVGNNFIGAVNGRTATVHHSDNAQETGFENTVVESRNTNGQDMPSIRCSANNNGIVYGLFARATAFAGQNITCDVTVVRDDNFARGPTPFAALVGQDGNAGVLVAVGVNMPFINAAGGLGQHRLGSHMSIATNPTNANDVFIAWTDRPGATGTNLHTRRSTNGGVTWTNDLLNIPNGLNPAIAINSIGVIGVLYQQLVNGRWQVHLRRSTDGINWTDLILSDTPDNTPPPTFQPYLGDYIDLMCVGQNFYGVFSASNVPNLDNFPQGVSYQRNANFANNQLFDRAGNTVNPSIDPFFFAIESASNFVSSLNVEITVGDDHLGDTAWPHREHVSEDIVTVFLSDGTSIPVRLNEGQVWPAHSTHNRIIPLPENISLEDITSIEIRHDAAGPDWGADNWTLQEITISATSTSGENRVILERFGRPLWQFRKNDNQVLSFAF